MKFLIISGAPNTGKTTSLNKIADWLTNGVVTTDLDGNTLPQFTHSPSSLSMDFSIIIMLHGKKIIIHSATDDIANMNVLIDKLKLHPDTDVVITSCRDIGVEKNYFNAYIKPYSSFILESPLAKVTRRSSTSIAKTWYSNSIHHLHQHILTNSPYYL